MLQIPSVILVVLLYNVAAEVNDRYYPRYHLAPPYGWMNDPNGFSIFNNEYHLFYQYNPNSSQEPGIASWGHAKSNDFFNWEHLPIALYPEEDYDVSGAFSGSAIIENNQMYLYYTGNAKFPGGTPDHLNSQALAFSTDGNHFTKYEKNPIISADNQEPDKRDPKVWKHNDIYYMVLGNSFNNSTLGRVLLYASTDMISWEQVSVIGQSNGTLGYMWECPDFFELDGKFVLLFSPQGVAAVGDKYKNLYQVGYFVGNFDYETNQFNPTSEFKELDHGHDFYATQTLLTDDGRRVMVAWLDMWDQGYPEQNDGFTGQMSLIRELTLTQDETLIQKPVKEISEARGFTKQSGKADNQTVVTLDDNAGEIIIVTEVRDIELKIGSGNKPNNTVTITFDSSKGQVTLDRGGDDGVRRTEWKPEGKLTMTLYVDASSIEVFCGEGEVTFSSRFFPDGDITITLGENTEIEEFLVTLMNRTVQKPCQTTLP